MSQLRKGTVQAVLISFAPKVSRGSAAGCEAGLCPAVRLLKEIGRSPTSHRAAEPVGGIWSTRGDRRRKSVVGPVKGTSHE